MIKKIRTTLLVCAFLLSAAFTVLLSIELGDSHTRFLFVAMAILFESAKLWSLYEARLNWRFSRVKSILCGILAAMLFGFSLMGTVVYFENNSAQRELEESNARAMELHRQQVIDAQNAAMEALKKNINDEILADRMSRARVLSQRLDELSQNHTKYIEGHPPILWSSHTIPMGPTPILGAILLELIGAMLVVCGGASRGVLSVRIPQLPIEDVQESIGAESRIKQIVLSGKHPLRLRDVAKTAKVNALRASQIMRDLESQGILERDDRNRYVLAG